MATLDLHSLKVEADDDFLDAADAQPFNDGSQFEQYGLQSSSLHQDAVYPVPFHAHTPYTDVGGTGIVGGSAGLHPERNFGNEGLENFANKMPHPRHHGKLLSSGSSMKQHHGVTSAGSAPTTTERAYGNCRKTLATYNGRRSTSERRDRINERERDRMHMLCDAFEQLRQVLPLKRPKRGPHRQKLSKISTLLFAQNYIRTLEDILQNPAGYADCQLSPSNGDASGTVCANLSIPPSSVPNRSTESDFGALFNQPEFYHQQYTNDVFMDPSYATF